MSNIHKKRKIDAKKNEKNESFCAKIEFFDET